MTIATTALRGLSRRLRIAAVFLAAAATLPFASPSFADSAPLKIGTATSPQIDALKIAVREAKEQGLDVKLIEFTDWNTPNAALANKDIDVNYFQHVPFLENAKKQDIIVKKSQGAGNVLQGRKGQGFDMIDTVFPIGMHGNAQLRGR